MFLTVLTRSSLRLHEGIPANELWPGFRRAGASHCSNTPRPR